MFEFLAAAVAFAMVVVSGPSPCIVVKAVVA